MDLIGPQEPAPALLLLGSGPEGQELRELCRSAGFLLDHATSRAEAMELFLERGGHEIVICHGELEGGMRATVMALSGIRSDLVCFVLPEGELLGLRELLLGSLDPGS